MAHVPHRITATASVRALRRAATQGEQILWPALRDRRFLGLKFRRQHVLFGFIADFYCHELGLVVEVDGPSHEGRREWQDRVRDAALARRGITTLRVTEADVRCDLERVLRHLTVVARAVAKERPLFRGRGALAGRYVKPRG